MVKKAKNSKPEQKYPVGSIVIHNPDGSFGGENDIFFHIHYARYGNSQFNPEKQWLYGGIEFEIEDKTIVPKSVVHNVAEREMIKLEGLAMEFTSRKY